MLVDSAVAGQDATEAFYGLHRHEVLERPQYARLQIGVLRGEQSVITGRLVGGLSGVPFAEPTYLTKGFHSPYYTEVRVLCLHLRVSWNHFFSRSVYYRACCGGCDRITRCSRRPSGSFSMRRCIPMLRSANLTGSDLARRFLTRWRGSGFA